MLSSNFDEFSECFSEGFESNLNYSDFHRESVHFCIPVSLPHGYREGADSRQPFERLSIFNFRTKDKAGLKQ
jgi:hypothetical protein